MFDKYLLIVVQNDGNITIDQIDCVNSIESLEKSQDLQIPKQQFCNKEKYRKHRKLIGKLNWVVGIKVGFTYILQFILLQFKNENSFIVYIIHDIHHMLYATPVQNEIPYHW